MVGPRAARRLSIVEEAIDSPDSVRRVEDRRSRRTLLDQPLTLGAVALTGIWSLAVTGFILHKAMEFSMTAGVLMAVAIALFSVTLGQAAPVIPTT